VVSIDPEKHTSESIVELIKAKQVGVIGGTITMLGCGLQPIGREGASFFIVN
jgi:hypothetical protein